MHGSIEKRDEEEKGRKKLEKKRKKKEQMKKKKKKKMMKKKEKYIPGTVHTTRYRTVPYRTYTGSKENNRKNTHKTA